MNYLKKNAPLLVAIAIVVLGAGAITATTLSHAQSATTSSGTNGTNMLHKMGMFGHGRGPGIMGTVSAISGNALTVAGKNGTTYTVDASSATVEKFTNNTKTTISVSQIAVNDTVAVMGTVSGTNVTAKNIIDGDFPKPPAPAASGTISGISGNTITLTGTDGTTYTVDASNAELDTHKAAGTTVANSGIISGDTITVFGTTSGNSIAATRIMDGDMQGKMDWHGPMGPPEGQ